QTHARRMDALTCQTEVREQIGSRVGPYVVTKRLEPSALGSRALALHDLDSTSHVLHRFSRAARQIDERAFLAAVAGISGLAGSHILPIEDHGLDRHGQPWA